MPFDIPTARMRGPISLHLYQYLLLTVLVIVIPVEVVTVSVWFLICIFQRVNDVEDFKC